jgi:endonuclease YncB( thermonuclease family)
MKRKQIRPPSPALFVLTVVSCLVIWRLFNAVDTPAVIPQTVTAKVDRVIDGDTVALADGRRVRLLGIDTTELGYNGDPSEPGAEAARDWLKDRLTGQDVELRYGPNRFDRFGRTLAWIFLPTGELINKELLAEGQARLVTQFGLPGDLSAELHQATAQAQVQHIGIWNND